MQAKTVQLSSQKINYYESEGTGPAVMLIHGNSASGLSYQHQINSPLGAKYRLVAMDLPGHGLSDPAPDPAEYSMPGYARVMAAVAEALGMQDAVFVGWSLGGHIVLEADNLLPNAAGLAIFGTPPLAFPPDMEHAFLPNPAMGAAFQAELSAEQAHAFATAFFAPQAAVDPAPFIADIMRTDGQARANMAASIKPDGYQDEVEIVANMTRPLAILHGQEEQLVSATYLSGLKMPTLWRGAVQIIPNAGHASHWEQPDAFNALLDAFITDI